MDLSQSDYVNGPYVSRKKVSISKQVSCKLIMPVK